MPFFRIEDRLIYYAHVPKCGGSSVATYIQQRFGPLAFSDRTNQTRPEPRWTRSSPQHVDAETLDWLIPLSFFSASFAIVRHPVGRAVSTYHFHREVERTIPSGTSFSDCLKQLEAGRAGGDPFAYDNHIRPMAEIVPPGAVIFPLEQGLDALVDWFDAQAGNTSGPRALPADNARGAHVRIRSEPVRPDTGDLARIARIYAADFKRFGYALEMDRPVRPPQPGHPAPPGVGQRTREAAEKLRRRVVGKFGRMVQR